MSSAFDLSVGDSLALLRDMPTASQDGLITDPPYSSGGATRSDRTATTKAKYVDRKFANDALPDFEGDNRDQRAFLLWASLWLAECHRIVKPGGIAAVFCDWRQLPTVTDAIQVGGWVWRSIIPWNKTEATRPQKGRPRSQCEYVVFGTRGPHSPYPDAPCIPGFYEQAAPRDRVHITQKPVRLMRDLVRLVPPGGRLLDPFAGSGTTGVAAVLEGRRPTLFEMVPEIAEVARERCELAAGEFRPGAQQVDLFATRKGDDAA